MENYKVRVYCENCIKFNKKEKTCEETCIDYSGFYKF